MIIHRSIFKELFINLIVTLFSLSVLLFMQKFVKLTRLFLGKGADIMDILKVFWYLQPSILLLAVPMALLIATFLTYGRMSSDSELVVLKGSGVSFAGIVRSSIILALLCFIFQMFNSAYLLPTSMVSFKKTLHETIIKKASLTLEEESFSDVFKDTVIFVNEIPSEKEFRGIFIYREADEKVKEPLVIVAEKGEIISVPEEGLIHITMNNGLIHSYENEKSSEISFAKYDFILTSGIESTDKTKPEEVSTMQLWKDRKKITSWAIELHRRFALPFACLIFGILGPALSSTMGKIGRLGGFSLSLSILILYYLLLVMGEGLSKANKLAPVWSGWTPNILFGAIAALFFYKAYKDRPVKRF
jgi:lipopolysaccharide export system permease protein